MKKNQRQQEKRSVGPSRRALDLAAEDLSRSGLALNGLTGVEVVDDASLIIPTAPAMPALVFDYHEPWRSPRPWVPRAEFCRIRLLGIPPVLPGQFQVMAPARYLQPQGSLNGVYLPKHHDVDWALVCQDTDIPIIFTEGEKKAWAGCNNGFTVVALGGVTMISAEKKGVKELEFFRLVKWQGRTAYVIFDTDTAGGLKPQVALAAARLMDMLLRKGAIPALVVLPPKRDGDKRGLDDFLLEEGAARLEDLIDRAQPIDAAKALFRLSEKYTYIRELGRFHDSQTQALITKDHLVTQERNQTVDCMVRKAISSQGQRQARWVLDVLTAGEAFIQWEARPEAVSIIYQPGASKFVDQSLNVWSGWGCEEEEKGDISEFMWALDNTFADDPVAREFIEHWLFYPIRFPGTKLFTVALVISPEQGIGKTFPAEMLARYVYGMRNASILQEGDIGGDYNSFLVNRQLVIGDDIAGSDAYHHLARIQSLVTNELLICKTKYVPEFTVRNLANFYLTANNVPFKLLDDDRRFFVHRPTKAKKDLERYTRLQQAFEQGLGRKVLWHARHVYDPGKFIPKAAAPDTKGKRELISMGRSDLETWAHSLRERSDFLTRDWATVAELYALWQLESGGLGNITPQIMSRALSKQRFSRWRDGALIRVFDRPERVWLLKNSDEWNSKEPHELAAYAERNKEFRAANRPSLKEVTKVRKY